MRKRVGEKEGMVVFVEEKAVLRILKKKKLQSSSQYTEKVPRMSLRAKITSKKTIWVGRNEYNPTLLAC